MGIRRWPKRSYQPGTYRTTCDESGFDALRSELITLYDGRNVLPEYYEPEPYGWRRRPIRKERTLKID